MMHVAVDLGAGSGRVMLGDLGDERFDLREVHRFAHPMTRIDGHLRWDAPHILAEIKRGLGAAGRAARDLAGAIVSLGVDSWGVDYGLVDRAGRLLEAPICYRDERTRGRMDEVFREVPRREVFDRTGIQFVELNTLYHREA